MDQICSLMIRPSALIASTCLAGVLLQELFKLKHYNDLDGGILEGFGRLLKFDLKIYVYPTLDTKTGEVITAENVKVSKSPPS